jgi:hypothetical protein
MGSFAAGYEPPVVAESQTDAATKPRAKLSHLRNYRFCEELDKDKRGVPARVKVKGATWMEWTRCAGSEWYELESET